MTPFFYSQKAKPNVLLVHICGSLNYCPKITHFLHTQPHTQTLTRIFEDKRAILCIIHAVCAMMLLAYTSWRRKYKCVRIESHTFVPYPQMYPQRQPKMYERLRASGPFTATALRTTLARCIAQHCSRREALLLLRFYIPCTDMPPAVRAKNKTPNCNG